MFHIKTPVSCISNYCIGLLFSVVSVFSTTFYFWFNKDCESVSPITCL